MIFESNKVEHNFELNKAFVIEEVDSTIIVEGITVVVVVLFYLLFKYFNIWLKFLLSLF